MHVLKYILFDNEVPLVFPAEYLHADIASGVPGADPMRAGFITFDGPAAGVYTFGDSESLGLSSSKDDAKIIEDYYRGV